MSMERLYERYTETKKYKDRWLALYKDLYYYVIPDRDAFNVKFNYRDDGKPTTQMVWDYTAVDAAYTRANDLHGLLMPKDRVWGKLSMDPHIFSEQEIESMATRLDEINDNIFFRINQSNLSRIAAESNLDLVGGTAALWVESIDDDQPLYFRSIPAVCLYVEYSTDDLLNTCWYQIKMTGRAITEQFPKYAGKSLGALLAAPNEIYTVVYGQIKMSENKFYIYAVLEIDPFTILFEKESSYNQIIIYRDRVRPGECEGRGPGVDLMSTIIDLNRIVQDDRKSLARKANPPMFYNAGGYFNPNVIKQWAGAFFPRDPMMAKNPLEALNMPEHPDVMNRILDLREVIKKGFQVDPLGDIDQGPKQTATEIAVRDRRAQRTSATDISRLINELPAQVYTVAAKILSERRLLTRDRKVELNSASSRLKFSFQSPLFDLQKEDNLNRFMHSIQINEQIYGPGSAMAGLDPVEVQSWLIEQLNMPHKLYKTGTELQKVLGQIAQNMQQQQAGQQAQAGPPSQGAGAPPGATV